MRRPSSFSALPFLTLAACIPASVEPQTASAQAESPTRYPDPIPKAVRDPDPKASRPVHTLELDLTPVWSMQKVVPNAVTVTSAIHIVQSGETLGGIGNRTGAGAEAIARANALVPPYQLQPGQRLAIPAGRYHRVAEGETGIAIARAYAVDWGRIVALNALQPPFMLRPGQRLMLPPEAPSHKPTLEERAAAFHIDIDDILTGGQPAAPADAHPASPTTTPRKPLPANAPIAEPDAFAGSFAWPAPGKVVTSFGPGQNGQRSNGIDIATPRGTPIRASAGGVVAFAGSVSVFGGLILVNHGSGLVTAYGYADRVGVTRGQRVEKGQTLGLSGDTGYADRPMLHFEIRKDRKPIDPLTRLPAR